MLAGIAFYGLDVGHPFVEVVGQDGPVEAPALAAALAEAFRPFAPRRFRTFGRGAPSDATLDQVLVAGRIDELLRRPPPPTLPRVRLIPSGIERALRGYREIWAALLAERPHLVGRVGPHDDDELAACAGRGQLWVIEVDGHDAGVLAARPEQLRGLDGIVVVEELLAPPWRGRSLAPPAQRRLLEALPRDQVLFGTIDGINTPSRRTARRVGRVEVGAWWFGRLPDPHLPRG